MPPPPRPSGSISFPSARGVVVTNSVPIYEIVKTRILMKVQDKLDATKARRMPPSLFAQTARVVVEQVIETEGARLPRADRDKLLDEIFAEAFGYGPLEELFADPAVKEITVLGAHAILARRDQGWLPTNIRFRDDDHLHEVLDKARMHGEAVGGALPGSVLDVKLTNGWRVVAVIPPPASGQPPTAAFVRVPDGGTQTHPSLSAGTGTHTHAALPPTGSASAGVRPSHSAAAAVTTPAPKAPSERITTPPPRAITRSPAPGEAHPLERYRVRITARLIEKLASLGVYDLSRLDTAELRKVVAAYVTEYCQVERVYLSDADQGRLTLEILAGMNR